VLKSVLTELHANEAFLIATLVTAGYLDANASPERIEAVLAEMRADLEAAGIEALVAAPAAPTAPAAPAPAAKA
jgi:hypothetical protein